METALRVLGRCVAWLAISMLLITIAAMVRRLTAYDGTFLAGWLSCVAFWGLFPSCRIWGAP
jgi:TRAP-type mannitol/chloroaromatic compound transport system permease small subunit